MGRAHDCDSSLRKALVEGAASKTMSESRVLVKTVTTEEDSRWADQEVESRASGVDENPLSHTGIVGEERRGKVLDERPEVKMRMNALRW
jgi:hypothetical protein